MKMMHGGFFSLVVLLSVAAPSGLRSQTLEYPKDKPAIKVELPAGWKGKDEGSYLSAYKEGDKGQVHIKLIDDDAKVTDDDSAKAALCDLAKKQTVVGEGTCSEPVERQIAGHTAYTGIITGKALGSPATSEITVFTPDGTKWFAASSMIGDVGQTDWGNEPIFKAIKSVDGDKEEKEEE
jgi:hypothetical protein